jgi:phosphoribosylformylglycinamidine cyclo-ligase
MKESAYKQAGVDIDAADELIESIKPHVKKTNRSGVMAGLGGFGALFDLKQTGFKDPVLVSSTDGVGTKIKLAIDLDRHDTIGIDCVAMCVNDVVVQGGEPLFFLDYFATGKLVNRVAEAVIAGVAAGCQQANCALIGGETAEMPGLYAGGDYDLAGFTVGAVERDGIIDGSTITEGDVLLGLASSGFHSNGYSLVRHVIKSIKGFDFNAPAPFENNTSFANAILRPTRIYVRSVVAALKITGANGKSAIKGMAHITGGGIYENVPRMLPDAVEARIDAKAWDLPGIFRWLAREGKLEHHDMARTLNCGIGMVIACDAAKAGEVKAKLEAAGETVYTLGSIQKRNVSDKPVVIDNIETAWH